MVYPCDIAQIVHLGEEMTTAGPWSHHALEIYMNEVGHYPLLDAQEERELATLYERGRTAHLRLQQEHTLSESERSRLQRDIARGRSARRRLIESNLRLVVKLIGPYIHCGLPYGDLVQEGNIGLIKAVERFDHERGVRFATYAGWWIKQSVLRAAANHGRTIRRPPWLIQKIGQMRKQRAAFEASQQRLPTDAELAQVLGWSVHRVREIAGYDLPELSLERTVSQEEDCQLVDLLADENVPAPAEEMVRHQACERLRAAMRAHLSPRAQTVLCLRYGFDGEPRRTLVQVAGKLGVTSERVRQIEKSAMRRLRKAIVREEL
jgi:RNA polymerase primary sigma factor